MARLAISKKIAERIAAMVSLGKWNGNRGRPLLAGCCGTPLAGLEEPKLDDGFPAPRLAGSMRARCFPET